MKNSIFTIFLLMFAYVQVWAGSGDERWPNYVAIAGNTGANPSEDYPYLLDNNSNTKWCVTGVSGTIYIEFDTTSPLMPTGYVLTTAKDTYPSCLGRNPKSWVIKGRNTTGGNWTTLATIDNGEMPTNNCTSKTFTLKTSTAYRYYRFEITSLVSGNIFQLSEFYFLVNDVNNSDIEDDPIEDANVLNLGSNGSSPLFADCPLDSVFIGRKISYPTNENQGYSPFYRNTSLRSVHISDVETEVYPNEFYGCTNLKNVRLGDGITTIGYWAFSGCFSIDYFSFGISMKEIGKEAFSDCTAMTKLISNAAIPPICGEQALDDINKWICILVVPGGYGAAYNAAPQWKEFFFVDESDVKTYTITYVLDGEKYKTIEAMAGAPLTTEVSPTKDGYTFSGWNGLPPIMPAHDVTVSGSFTINKYTLTYKVDGLIHKTSNVEYETAITPEAEPIKEGYTFSGWSEVPATMPAKEVVITGSFTINKYKLIYMVDDKTYKTIEVEYGASIAAESEPIKEGYSFSGWSLIPTTMPAKDVTVTGTFTINKYNLTYMIDGVTYKTSEVEYGTVIKSEAEPSKEGYTFSGWSEIPATMPAKDVTVTGSFTKGEYQLTYVVDGQAYKTIRMDYGNAITPEAAPEKEGYIFSGWSEIPATMPAKDVTVTGSFAINKYILTYMVDGETYKTSDVEYGTSITAEAEPTKEGYSFSGWSLIPTTMPAKDVIITGSFTKGKYKLVYMVDGQTYKTISFDYGAAITPEDAPEREGYTFYGWSEIPAAMPSKDVTVTGSFTINKYTLTYQVDGETYKTYEVEYGTDIIVEAEPTKEGYIFSGWSWIPDKMPAEDVTVTGSFTFIDAIEDVIADDGTYQIFTLDGKSVETLQKGVNIIRYSNGTTKNVYVK